MLEQKLLNAFIKQSLGKIWSNWIHEVHSDVWLYIKNESEKWKPIFNPNQLMQEKRIDFLRRISFQIKNLQWLE